MFFSRKREEKNEIEAKAEEVAATPKSRMDAIRDQIIEQLPSELREKIESGAKVNALTLTADNPLETVRTGVGLMVSGMMSALMQGGNMGLEGSSIASAINGVARLSPQVADAILKSVIVGCCTSVTKTPREFLEHLAEDAPDRLMDESGEVSVDNSPLRDDERANPEDVRELEDLFRLPPAEKDDEGR